MDTNVKKSFLIIMLITIAPFIFGQDVVLINAVKRGDMVGVQMALQYGANPNQFFKDGDTVKTALSFAVEQGNMRIVQALLTDNINGFKADPNATDGITPTPLMMAILSKNNSIIEILLKEGGNVSKQLSNGNNALHYAISGGDFHRFSQGDSNIVDTILRYGADINQPGQNGDTPAIMAAKSNRVDILDRFLSDPKFDLKITNDDGFNALTVVLNSGITSNINMFILERLLNTIHFSQILDLSENKINEKNYLVELANQGKDVAVKIVCRKDREIAKRTTPSMESVPFLLVGIQNGWSVDLIEMLVNNFPKWENLRDSLGKDALGYMNEYGRINMYGDILK
ncbi:hypothetical protein AGMMS50268_05520 [Spirochaetia bacterium]|nr:hypothetical protein AGMMS50268_05520 [Spirochaetia bacterium]